MAISDCRGRLQSYPVSTIPSFVTSLNSAKLKTHSLSGEWVSVVHQIVQCSNLARSGRCSRAIHDVLKQR